MGKGNLHIDQPTPAELAIVRRTWDQVSHIRLADDDANVSSSLAFGLCFYNAIFREDPDLQKLFPNIMKQARALTGMISYITKPADNLGELEASMRELGSRHAFYGVKIEMFRVVGQAFVSALEERLEDKYDAETGRCWLKAYIFVSHNMKMGLESQLNWEEERRIPTQHEHAHSSHHHHSDKPHCSIQ
ncbi:globin-like protein [Umbelopsis sp. AD052]|nr:globin-like protein [Umbelopsis sp. AD052]